MAFVALSDVEPSSCVSLSRVLRTAPSEPVKVAELADETQTISLSLSDFDYGIVVSSYSQSNLNKQFMYTITFTVTGGSLEFFICLQPEANLWAQGYDIYISTSNHWASTSGVTTTRNFMSNVALAFVFNHESSGSRSVSGSITVDTSPPSIKSSLIHNATYNGTVAITANATDTMTGVESMELFIDGESKHTASSGLLEYDWNTALYSNGNHTIAIQAKDGAGHGRLVVYELWVENAGFLMPSLNLLVGLGLGGAFSAAVIIYCLVRRRRAGG